jgi:hypothetical protein
MYTHLPQVLKYKTDQPPLPPEKESTEDLKERERFKWTEHTANMLVSEHSKEIIASFNEYVDLNDVNKAATSLVELLQHSCKKSVSKKPSQVKPYKAEWWDDELEAEKRHKYKLLRLYRKENSQDSLQNYRLARKSFKNLCRIKQNTYKLNTRKKIESCTSSVEFWKLIKACKQTKHCVHNISTTEWNNYFSELLNSSNILDEEHSQSVKAYMTWHDTNCEECKLEDEGALNANITLDEVENAIKLLPNKKSPGIDGIINEIIKQSQMILAPLLCRLYNVVLSTGVYPNEWANAIIIPIHKKGNVNEPSNYRGIALLSNIGKLFSKIINNRIVAWSIENGKMFEEQAGFTKGKSTVDHIFVLESVIRKYLSKKGGRFYTVFVDFSKAFDTVPHMHLFYRLITEGVHGRVLNVLTDMYSKLKSCIQSDEKLTKLFECIVGTRQGCMLSPFLFIFYLNQLIKMSISNNCPGIHVNDDFPNLTMLLYADDLVLLGDQPGRVQRLLNVLSEYCNKWGLKVNLDKTRAMIFRNGGIISRHEKFYLNGVEIESCSYYKYLGLIMSTRLSWSPAQQTLSSQALKAMHLVTHVNYKCNFSFKVSDKLFDTCIIPMITYGSEIWGLNVHKDIEHVQNKFYRKVLGVGSKTPSVAILGECGRLKVYIHCYVKCIKYWLKLLSLPKTSLLYSCYDMLFKQDSAQRHNWASKVREILCMYGFGFVWYNQGVEDIDGFMKEFKLRLIDCEMQNWNGHKQTLSKLQYYNMYKTVLLPEGYLYLEIPHKFKTALAKLRTTSHTLEIETGRHKNVNMEDRLCKLCGNSNLYFIESEYHVFMECSVYDDLRKKYLSKTNIITVNIETFVDIMQTIDSEILSSICKFVYYMFELRKEFLSKQK